MRRLLSLILILLGVFLMSCSSDGVYSVDMQYGEFDFYGEYEVDGCVYTGRFYISDGKRLSEREKYIILSSPEALSDMRIDVSEGSAQLNCDGISLDVGATDVGRVFELFDIPRSAVFRRDGDSLIALYEKKTYNIVYEGGAVKSISCTNGTDIMSVRIIERYE